MTKPPDDNPFAKLATLREQLPPGEAPKELSIREQRKLKPPFLDKVVVRFTRKGHGGKTVTVITGVAPHALETVCSEMKRALGVGARIEGGDVVLQGDLVDRAVTFLEKKGATKIVRGT